MDIIGLKCLYHTYILHSSCKPFQKEDLI